jgi:hypothetical protein
VVAVIPTTLGLSFLAMVVGFPVVAWTAVEEVVLVGRGRSVDEVVEDDVAEDEMVVDEVVVLLGGLAVVAVDQVSPGPEAMVEVLA